MTTMQDNQYDSVVDLTVEGTITQDDSTIFIDFCNNDNSSKMRIGISPDMISVSRFDTEVYTMILQQDLKTNSVIKTKYGEIPMSILTHSIQYSNTDNNLDLRLDYTLQLVGDSPSHNRLDLKCVKHT
ncbi:MAG: DUF1934 domain-containing protein [Clostridiales bacterium]|nr:DUF1934 domain-containing protein [Clostridiales bacterium]